MNLQNDQANTGLRHVARSAAIALAVAMGAALLAAPQGAKAQSGTQSGNTSFEDAHSLRSLDIMLMVTALRCRGGSDDFQADYHRFSAANLKHLNAASTTLKRTFQASYGERNPARALDRMGVKIANSYGDGHPWLTCAQLRQVAQGLSQASDATTLAANARYLLSAAPPPAVPGAISEQIAKRFSGAGGNAQISYNMTADWEKRP